MHYLDSESAHKQSGFAMIEVLVTAIIFAIGISGMGVLLLKTIQGTQDNAQRSQGMWIVQDFIGRIRANPEGAKAGRYVTTGVTCSNKPTTMCADHIIDNAEQKIAVACSSDDMAAFDIWVTMCGFDDPLPEDRDPTITELNDRIFDSPAEFLVNPVLTSSCAPPCIEYVVNLTWQSRITDSEGVVATSMNVSDYEMTVELN